jgi:hypothetical protein
MHPAIYSALVDARETEPRTAARRVPRRPRRRLAGVAAAAAVVVAGAIAVSDSSAAVTPRADTSTPVVRPVRFDGPAIAQPGQFGWQAQCPLGD